MSSLSEFFHMGGYAAFVWPCFIVAAVVMGGLLVSSLRYERQMERTLSTLEKANPGRRRRRQRSANPDTAEAASDA